MTQVQRFEYQKPFRELNLDEVVDIHLSHQPRSQTADFDITSCLHELENATIHSRGLRNTRIYAPALCAFAMLDQIGSCYSDNTMGNHPNEGTGVHRALYYFCNMPAMSDEVKALYAFRNGLIHDGSFTSKSTKTGQWYIFRYNDQLVSPVQMAKTPWDGTGKTFGDDVTTYINMRVFTDLVYLAWRNCAARTMNANRISL